jgi:hypothetical protein
MERSIGLERTYSLGDYKNLKISDFVSDLPEELVLNDEFITSFRSLQLVNFEKLYYEYALLGEEVSGLETLQEKVDYLTKVETDLYTKLVGLMTQENGQEESE